MAPNGTEFRWSATRSRVAALVAEDGQTDVAIAAACGIGKRTLERWKSHPAFAAAVDRVREELRAKAEADGVANRKNRVAALNDRWRRMQRVIDARAEEHANVPGGATGLLVRQVKLVKVYDAGSYEAPEEGDPDRDTLQAVKGKAVEVAEYAVDTGLLKELREHELQAAKELGQWEEKTKVNLAIEKELEGLLDKLQGQLPADDYARVLQALAAGDAGA